MGRDSLWAWDETPCGEPRSGKRIKPTAQAVGDKSKMRKPRSGERTILTHTLSAAPEVVRNP